MQKKSVLFLSSEHASNAVPEFLKAHFKSKEAKAVLKTHRGYDIGAGDVFWELAKILRTSYAIQGAYTRLAIDLNRNSNKNHRYSEFTEQATDVEKQRLEGYWDGFRDAFLGAVKAELSKKNPSQIIHLSIHSFTPGLGEIAVPVKMPATRTWTERPHEPSLYFDIGFRARMCRIGGRL